MLISKYNNGIRLDMHGWTHDEDSIQSLQPTFTKVSYSFGKVEMKSKIVAIIPDVSCLHRWSMHVYLDQWNFSIPHVDLSDQ
jgi:hypothetical protein